MSFGGASTPGAPIEPLDEGSAARAVEVALVNNTMHPAFKAHVHISLSMEKICHKIILKRHGPADWAGGLI